MNASTVTEQNNELAGYPGRILSGSAVDEAIAALNHDRVPSHLDASLFKTVLALEGMSTRSASDFLALDIGAARGRLKDVPISTAMIAIQGPVVVENINVQSEDRLTRQGIVMTEGVVLTHGHRRSGYAVIDAGSYFRTGHRIELPDERSGLVDPHLDEWGSRSELTPERGSESELRNLRVLEFLKEDGATMRIYIGPTTTVLTSHWTITGSQRINLAGLAHLGADALSIYDEGTKLTRKTLENAQTKFGNAWYNLLCTNPRSELLIGLDMRNNEVAGVHLISSNSERDLQPLAASLVQAGIIASVTSIGVPPMLREQRHVLSIPVGTPEAFHRALDTVTTLVREGDFGTLQLPPT